MVDETKKDEEPVTTEEVTTETAPDKGTIDPPVTTEGCVAPDKGPICDPP